MDRLRPNVEQPMVLAQLILAFSAPADPGEAPSGARASEGRSTTVPR
ncbi:hypothetical protein OV079_16030 [Nannocystis pusilla]|uniref:Uncharacterized protein n=1 Tax=Nannocystis pusilla TaxID=889268 RepID=A0A9X3EWW3_9BACT|nr:hypothetical protein [Nannocystis pusilla]MCY1007038.1 hypothetical protein [Nannocystis pusilla]